MPLHTTDALILRTYKLGESDRIVVFLTRDRGQEARRREERASEPAALRGGLEPLTYGRVGYMERERRDLVSCTT
jgi:Recombinational DNA repair protein (RecF pathway)